MINTISANIVDILCATSVDAKIASIANINTMSISAESVSTSITNDCAVGIAVDYKKTTEATSLWKNRVSNICLIASVAIIMSNITSIIEVAEKLSCNGDIALKEKKFSILEGIGGEKIGS